MVEARLSSIENKGLFLKHYLEDRLIRRNEWEINVESAFSEIRKIYQDKKESLSAHNEKQLRKNYINPVLKLLNHYFEIEGKIEGVIKFPDYGLFPTEKTAKEAIILQGTEDFYKKAIGICEAKAWNIKLDKSDFKGEDRDKRIPNAQIDEYLRWTEKRWGILTNGKLWRLYYRENSYRNYYYQINLEEVIEHENITGFKYFYLFFRREAFELDINNLCFLDKVLQGSSDYAKEIEENIENNVYNAMRILADGFINHKGNKLDKHRDLKLAQENTMKFLYRLLFILFAEANGLLDISRETRSSKTYADNYSLDTLKKVITHKLNEGLVEGDKYNFSYWMKLKELFGYINKGTEDEFKREEFYIPCYNGGLFDPLKNEFLEKKRIPNYYLAQAINLLASPKNGGGYFDYSSLDIRHLGSIYEGLLEYKLRIAEETMIVVKKGGKERWEKVSEYRGKKYIDKVDKNGLYLETYKGERKATGSYYTPDYIVKYIVHSALEPIVDKKIKDAQMNGKKHSDAILSIKVLDPAMGSGHFLVEVVDTLKKHLLEAITEDVKNKLLSESEDHTEEWAQREIVSHCIYGVDLNPMAVELAKVSLWLKTISKDKPLSFLDHRLKCGNSLIGEKLIDLPFYPELNKKNSRKEPMAETSVPKAFIEKLVNKIKELEEVKEEKLKDIKLKEKLFHEFQDSFEYEAIKTLANLRTSIYFGNTIDRDTYGKFTGDAFWSTEKEWNEKKNRTFINKVFQISEDKMFFHWELEYPEIFFEAGKTKENPGFDVVIGNPPYVRAEVADKEQRSYLMQSKGYNGIYGRFDVYLPFLERGTTLTRRGGYVGYIIPASFLSINYGSKLREILIEKYSIERIVDLRGVNVFPDASVECCIPIIKLIDPTEKSKTSIGKYAENEIPPIHTSHFIKQGIFRTFSNYSFRLDIDNSSIQIREKIDNVSIKLGDICYCITGVVAHDSLTGASKDRLINERPISSASKPYIEAKEWEGRYSSIYPVRYIEYLPKEMHRPKFTELFESEKVMIQGISSGLYIPATYDDTGVYCNHSLNCCVKLEDVIHHGTKLHLDDPQVVPDTNYKLYFVLALIASKLLGYYHSKFISNDLGIFPQTVRALPIRQISYTTSPDRRKKLSEKAKALYNECLKTKDNNLILDFVDINLRKNDVIHDLLAYFAEQMILMNKEKQKKIRSFQTDLEGIVDDITFIKLQKGKKSSVLYMKESFKQYVKENSSKNHYINEALCWDENAFKDFVKVLADRVINLSDIIDLYKKYAPTLKEIQEKIDRIDNLIDSTTYKLYELTDEEIELIEVSIAKSVDS